MKVKLPEAFLSRMEKTLGDEMQAFLQSMEEAPVRGIRVNPLKQGTETIAGDLNGPVPWEPDGWFLSTSSQAGMSLAHEAGAFYIQDPCAMIPGRVMNAAPGEWVLDLCSAPGGKATQMGLNMKGKGVLVCNEPVPSRARILSRNVERMGIPNAVVISAFPQDLAQKWGAVFDAVLVDAPCSGEGMFRKDPEACTEWSEERTFGCAERQRDILRQAARLVRPGGRLVYATCTWNPHENEETVDEFLREQPEFTPEGFSLPGIDGTKGCYTCYPHRLRGEGQFAALLRRKGCALETKRPVCQWTMADSGERNGVKAFFSHTSGPIYKRGNLLFSLPESPDLSGIRVLRTGLHLAERQGKVLTPDHASALAVSGAEPLHTVSLSAEYALRYAGGEEIPGDLNGWGIVRFAGMNLGWAKGSSGVMKNHYPKGLRNGRLIPGV